MANRSENRYKLPEYFGNDRDITEWVAGLPFFLGSAVKYIYRGWDDLDDLRKAIDCIKRHDNYAGAYIISVFACKVKTRDIEEILKNRKLNDWLKILLVLGKNEYKVLEQYIEILEKRIAELEAGNE